MFAFNSEYDTAFHLMWLTSQLVSPGTGDILQLMKLLHRLARWNW